eukprot:3820414-Prymnesium_polylepis.1
MCANSSLWGLLLAARAVAIAATDRTRWFGRNRHGDPTVARVRAVGATHDLVQLCELAGQRGRHRGGARKQFETPRAREAEARVASRLGGRLGAERSERDVRRHGPERRHPGVGPHRRARCNPIALQQEAAASTRRSHSRSAAAHGIRPRGACPPQLARLAATGAGRRTLWRRSAAVRRRRAFPGPSERSPCATAGRQRGRSAAAAAAPRAATGPSRATAIAPTTRRRGSRLSRWRA